MFGIPLIEWVGYLASVLIAASMFMKDIIKLRFINLIGSLCFVIYGVVIKAYPVALTNIVIVSVNLYYLYKITNEKNKNNSKGNGK
ncbi:MAG: YgjV family protein [Clostridium sp.]